MLGGYNTLHIILANIYRAFIMSAFPKWLTCVNLFTKPYKCRCSHISYSWRDCKRGSLKKLYEVHIASMW